jgi:hypothetical protein
MKKILTLFLCIAVTTVSFAQDDLLNDLMKDQDSTTELLPKKMLLTQRVLWGQKGLLRPISPLTATNREKELKLRRGMLVAHQVLGFVTLGGMVGQAINGPQLYKARESQNERQYDKVKGTHEALAVGVNLTYSATAVMSLFTPPPLINRDKKLSAIRLHKWLAVVHMGGMIATNVLAERANDPKIKPIHRAAAFATFASYAAAIVTIKF